MKAVVKLLGVLVLLAWAMHWPTHVIASSGGGYKCNTQYSSDAGQCWANMQACTEGCNNYNGSPTQYCIDSLDCNYALLPPYPWGCQIVSTCYYGPSTNCMQGCISQINYCEQEILAIDCQPCTGTECE